MILADITAFLRQHSQASLEEIALHFDTPPDAVSGMLEILVRKGRIQRQQLKPACGSCCKCDSAATVLYLWAGSPPGGSQQTRENQKARIG